MGSDNDQSVVAATQSPDDCYDRIMTTTHIPEYDKICAAATVVVHIHQSLAGFLKAGVTLAQIDRHVGEQLAKHKSKSSSGAVNTSGPPSVIKISCR